MRIIQLHILVATLILSCADKDDFCKSSKLLAKELIESGYFIEFVDDNFHSDPYFGYEYRITALEEILQLKYIERDTIAKDFDFKCYKNERDSILRIKYGDDYSLRIKEKSDSLQIDFLAESVEPDGIYSMVHKMPRYSMIDNWEELLDSISKEIYSRSLKQTEGKVFCEIIVDSTGNLMKYNVVRGISQELDSLSMLVLSRYESNWIPGEFYGRKVNVQMLLPFKIINGTHSNTE